jgi:sugar O-acyltransferase (sialic acid O-acetyltransferase NeuD family)
MTMPILILGSGGHAKVLIDAISGQKVNIIGILDPDTEKHHEKIYGISVIGDDSVILSYKADEILLINGLGSVKSTEKRRNIFEHFKSLGYSFATVIHSSAIIASDVIVSEGAQIMAGAVIQPGAVIGENTIVNTKTSIDHDCSICSHVHIAPGVTVSGNVSVGENTHIGSGAVIIQGVKIDSNCLIGAGSLVLKNIPAGKVAWGVPAKIKDILLSKREGK